MKRTRPISICSSDPSCCPTLVDSDHGDDAGAVVSQSYCKSGLSYSNTEHPTSYSMVVPPELSSVECNHLAMLNNLLKTKTTAVALTWIIRALQKQFETADPSYFYRLVCAGASAGKMYCFFRHTSCLRVASTVYIAGIHVPYTPTCHE